MFGIITAFFRGNIMKIGISLLVTALISGGGWFLNNKYETQKAYERQQIEVLAIVTNEYEHTLNLLENNTEKFRLYREHMKLIDKVLSEKHKADDKKAKGLIEIRERNKNVDDGKDGEVSDILNDTLDGIRMLREGRDGRKG